MKSHLLVAVWGIFSCFLVACTSPTRTALILQNDPLVPLGNLEEVLKEKGFTIDILPAYEKSIALLDPTVPHLVVSLGGRMAAYDGSAQMEEQAEFLRKRILANQPVIGLCLGAQLTAKALGAPVYAGFESEIGWKKLIFSSAGQSHPLAQALQQGNIEVYTSHGDTFDLPTDATLLASTQAYPHHAFTYKKAIALQFHPEVDDTIIQGWFQLYHRLTVQDKENILHENPRKTTTQRKAMKAFWVKWLEENT